MRFFFCVFGERQSKGGAAANATRCDSFLKILPHVGVEQGHLIAGVDPGCVLLEERNPCTEIATGLQHSCCFRGPHRVT